MEEAGGARSTEARQSACDTVSFDWFPVRFDEGGVWLQASSRTSAGLEVVDDVAVNEPSAA
jgi:hypothetical protein